MIKKIAIVVFIALVVLIAGVLILAATKPDTFRVERAATIQAPPEKIFSLINDFKVGKDFETGLANMKAAAEKK